LSRRVVATAALLIGVWAAACARPYPPPGGDRDTLPPRLVGTTPAPFAMIAAGDEPVVFRFDERLSERGFSEALVLVSPRDSAVRVDRGRSEVRIRIDGGWRPDRVYRIVLLPGVRDLFSNERSDQVELVFSTGATIDSTALAGLVLDRITGGAARSGVVEAVHVEQGARYVSIADSSGFYSLRYLPLGAYDIRAYDDQNRNRRRDLLEPVDSGHTVVLAGAADTIAHIFHVLIPDTTAPRIVRAQSVDSLHVRVSIDDHIDVQQLADGVPAIVHALPDSIAVAEGTEVMTSAELQQRQRSDTIAVPATPSLLPVQDVVVRLNRVLQPGTYTITIGPVTNLHGLRGSGTVRFEVAVREAPPAPDPPPPDTTVQRSARLRR
jgi:hypothetical protein